MNVMHASRLVAALLSIPLVLGSASCADASQPTESGREIGQSQAGELTRVKLYDSVQQLTLDSQVIVVGRVINQQVVADITPTTDFTLANISIDAIIKGGNAVDLGSQVIVRQTGSSKQPTGAPFMTVGDHYLLFLVKSELPGEKASHFYVTGATAGIFALRTGESTALEQIVSAKFTRLDEGSGDRLPATLVPTQIIG